MSQIHSPVITNRCPDTLLSLCNLLQLQIAEKYQKYLIKLPKLIDFGHREYRDAADV
jgi:hypothetical protein